MFFKEHVLFVLKQQNKTRFFKTSDQESMPPTESDADDNSME